MRILTDSLDRRYATPEQLSEMGRDLYRSACPTPADEPFFMEHIAEAKALGLTWLEELEYVIVTRALGPAPPIR